MLVLFCGISAVLIVALIAFNSGNISGFNVFFGSFTLRLVLTVYGHTVLVSFVFAYLGQHWYAEEIKIAYIQCKDIVDSMGDSFQNINFSSYLFEMLLKTVVVDIVTVIVSYSSVSSTDLLASRPYFVFALMLPPYAVRLHMNVFYGAVLAIDVYVRKLNCHLVDIVAKATYNSARHKHLKMGNYCFCSDEVDRLSMLYSKLVQATKSLNSIFSIQIALWNTTILVTLIVQFLLQFVTIIELALNRNETAMMINIQGCISIIISSFDLLSTTYACQRLNDSVNYLPLFSTK